MKTEFYLANNRAASIEARDEAIERVGINNVIWIRSVLPFVHDICERRELFTTDAVRWHADRKIGPAREPRAMGAVMAKAAARGWCEPTNETRQSTRVPCHRRPLRVWRSLLWEP
jgi:hypothetical protein